MQPVHDFKKFKNLKSDQKIFNIINRYLSNIIWLNDQRLGNLKKIKKLIFNKKTQNITLK